MELTDREQEAKVYAARCFDMRYGLIQQVSCDLLARLVSTERAYMEIAPDEMPAKAVSMAVNLLDEIDRVTDQNAEQIRDYYARRHKNIGIAWDPSKFSSETWLKKALNPEDGNQ